MTSKQIAEIIVKHSASNRHCSWVYAVRADRAGQNVGQTMDRSHDWDHENDCPSDDLLGGTCGTRINADATDDEDDLAEAVEQALKANGKYSGARYLIAGDAEMAQDGEDDGEVILATTCGMDLLGAEIVAAL